MTGKGRSHGLAGVLLSVLACRSPERPPTPPPATQPAATPHLPAATAHLSTAATPHLSSAATPHLPASATPTEAAASAGLPAPATWETGVALADWNTATERDPLGFADAPWLLDRAGAWLRARLGLPASAAAATGPVVWQRRDRRGRQLDVFEWQGGGVRMHTQGDDVQLVLDGSGCTVRVNERLARCEADPAAHLGLAAAVIALAQPDRPGRETLFVEAMRVDLTRHEARLRLAIPTLRLRFELQVATDGTVLGVDLPGPQLSLQPDPDGLAVTERGQVPWHWTPAAREPELRTRTVLRLDNTAAAEVNHEGWDKAARERGLAATGPFSVTVDVRDDGLRVLAIEAPVLAATEEAPFRGVQVVAVRPTPVQTAIVARRAQLGQALRQRLAPGCHVAQLLGLVPDAPLLVGGAAREQADVVVVIRACP